MDFLKSTVFLYIVAVRLRYSSLLLTQRSGTIHSLAFPFSPSCSTIGHDPHPCVTLLSFLLHNRARFTCLRFPSLLLTPQSGTIHILALLFPPSHSTIGLDSHPCVTLLSFSLNNRARSTSVRYPSLLLARQSGTIRSFFATLQSTDSKTNKRPARMLSVLQSFILSNPF